MTPTARSAWDLAQLRVVQISLAAAWGGREQQASHLVEGLQQRGHACLTIARAGSPLADWLQRHRFPVLAVRGRGRHPWDMLRVRRRLAGWAPDVVHFNDPHATTFGSLALLGLAVPARVAVKSTSFPMRTPFRYRRLCDRVICVASSAFAACRQAGIPASQLRLVHSGCEPSLVRGGDRGQLRHELGLTHDDLVLLNVANLLPVKGHASLLSAFRRVADQLPQAHLVVAGEGPLREALQARTRDLGLERRVHWLGFRRDLRQLFAAADLFVMSSQLEGICSTLIQSMMAGTPMVSTLTGGIGDLTDVQPPVAWTVPPDDHSALAEAIMQALRDPRQRELRARRARWRAAQFFSVDHMVDRTLEVYREIIWEKSRQISTSHERYRYMPT